MEKAPRKNILIVEDDVFLAKLYASYFENEHYHSIIEHEGEQGLYRMKNSEIDLAVIDLLMPKVTGFDMLEERQNDDHLKNIPVVVLTSLEQEDDRLRALALGADDYFTKNDVELEGLMQKVQKLLDA